MPRKASLFLFAVRLSLGSLLVRFVLFHDAVFRRWRLLGKLEKLQLAESVPLAEASVVASASVDTEEIEKDTDEQENWGQSEDAFSSQLMELADRFACTTEMAVLLAIMAIGGPQQLLYTNPAWSETTKRAVLRIQRAMMQNCRDDVEFSLKLYALWSELHYADLQTFAPSSPLLSSQEAWAARYFMRHDLLRDKVEPEKERLLQELSRNKREYERRQINIDLLAKTRLLVAFSLATTPTSTQARPSVSIDPEWEEWLRQRDYSLLALTRFINQQHGSWGNLTTAATGQRLFLDQRMPLGSLFLCRVSGTDQQGTVLVNILEQVSEAEKLREEFRSYAEFVAATGDTMPADGQEVGYLHMLSVDPPVHAQPEWSTTSLSERRIAATDLARLVTAPLSSPRGIIPITCCLQTSSSEEYQPGATLIAEVVSYDYTTLIRPLVILHPVPTNREQEPALAKVGEQGTGDLLALANREDYSTSIVVQHPIYKYTAGQRVLAHITDIKDFGIFVDTEPDVGGLVHKTKMWGYVVDARDFPFEIGDEIEVEIISVDYEKAKLELGLLREHDPIFNYQPGDIGEGRVTEVRDYGAFVELEPGVRGLVRKKSTWWGYIEDMRDFLWEDEEVTVRILSMDTQKHEMELSMQVDEHDPLLAYKPGDEVHAEVTQVRDFGAFVEVEPGVSGLILRDDMGPHVQNARRVLEEHDEVEALVIRIDYDKRRLLLSLERKIS